MSAQRKPTIVVGVSGSPASEAALRWAATETERLHGTLRIILAWRQEQRAHYARPADLADGSSGSERARRKLAETVRAVLGPGPQHSAVSEVVEGSAERKLVAESAAADLLVLGSGPGDCVGPVIRACLSQAQCPVVIVSPKSVHAAELRGLRCLPAHPGIRTGCGDQGQPRWPVLIPAPAAQQ